MFGGRGRICLLPSFTRVSTRDCHQHLPNQVTEVRPNGWYWMTVEVAGKDVRKLCAGWVPLRTKKSRDVSQPEDSRRRRSQFHLLERSQFSSTVWRRGKKTTVARIMGTYCSVRVTMSRKKGKCRRPLSARFSKLGVKRELVC